MVFKTAIAAAAVCGATMLASPASAMPIDNLAGAGRADVEQVRWVCGPYRCWWQPGPRFYVGPRFYGGYGPRFYGGYGPRFYGGYGGGFYRSW